MRKTKKVLIFLQDGVGGAERISILLGKSMPTDIFDVIFCLVERDNSNSASDFIPEGYQIVRIPNASPIKMIWQLYMIVLKLKPDIVFASVMYLNTKLLLFRYIFPRARFVIRSENYLYTFNRKQHVQIRMTYHMADAIIAQTREMADELINHMNINMKKVVILQNPIDEKTINSLLSGKSSPYVDNGKKHYVASGRFSYQKGFDLLLEAFLLLLKHNRDADLYIVGDNSCDDGMVHMQLMQRAKENGINDLIHCVGYQKNPYPYIRYADCFVLSSRWEGLPNVLIEALYLGTPVAAFKCIPVIERIVSDGENGFLASANNTRDLSIAMMEAVKMGRINNSYEPSSLDDFVNIISGNGVAT